MRISHAPRFTLHASRSTLHASRSTLHASRSTHHYSANQHGHDATRRSAERHGVPDDRERLAECFVEARKTRFANWDAELPGTLHTGLGEIDAARKQPFAILGFLQGGERQTSATQLDA